MTDPIPLSVIMTWRDPREDVGESLRSLLDQVDRVGGEVLVIHAKPGHEVTTLRSTFPTVVWITVDAPLTEPRAWEIGARSARGATLAFVQASCRYAPGWVDAILAARGEGARIVAGPVGLESGTRLAARAAYLCDYGAFADPNGRSAGGAASNNVAFDRSLISVGCFGGGLHKSLILRRSGTPVSWARGMATTTRPYRPCRADWAARFHRGRHFASRRSVAWTGPIRFLAGWGTIVLPWILLVRLLRIRRFRRTLALGTPWVLASLSVWSLGEMAGYWTGAGQSERWL